MQSILRILCLLFASAVSLANHAQTIVHDSLKIQGHMRHYAMYLPEGLPEGAPLVFVCHGYGNRGATKTWMNAAADHHKFAICIPVGLKDPRGKHSWNVGYPWQQDWKVDDVKAVCTLARHVQKKHRLSRRNTFLTGMSNGGELCYLLAYSKQSTFKAQAS